MPEEIVRCTDMMTALDRLEDHCLDNHLSRTQNYNTIHSVLEKKDALSVKEIERLLAVCVHDLKEDKKYAATIMDIIFVIVTRVKEGLYDPEPDLVPSAIAVLRMIKIASLSNLEAFKILCFRTLLSYSDATLLAATEKETEMLKIFEQYVHVAELNPVRTQALVFLNKLLKIMPPVRRKSFIEAGLNVWFSKVVPMTMSLFSRVSPDCVTALECLELLTDTIVTLEYSTNENWRQVITSLCNPQGYPLLMKKQLLEGNDLWQRVWIVFIRLLKHQITQSMANIGTPINSMLPVVEAAFKLDVQNRCKAFECWNVLIDSFSTETNESNINKRIKLIIIPLKSNNAKTEETALAKFKCWWRLISMFQNKMDKFLDTILVSFLHFCFGKHHSDKATLVPGQISVKAQKQSMYAMVEMLGHTNCNGCTELPKLAGKVINTKHLVDNWNYWIFSLTSTIILTIKSDQGLTSSQMMCLWKSFLVTIGELPENNIRKDLVVEMISVLAHMVKDCRINPRLADIMFNVMILSFFDEEIKIKHILKSRQEESDPLYRIVKILLDPSFDVLYKRYSMKDMVTKLKPLTNLSVHPIYSTPNHMTDWLLTNLPENDTGLMLWTALAESISESQCDMSVKIVSNLVLWPLKSINLLTDIKLPAMTWYKIYELLRLKKADIDNDVGKFLFSPNEDKGDIHTITYFKLCVLCAVLKHKNTDNSVDCQKEVELLKNLISNIDTYSNYEQLFPMLIDRFEAILDTGTTTNESVAIDIVQSTKHLLKLASASCLQQPEGTIEWSLAGNLLKYLSILFSHKNHSNLSSIIINDLIEHASVFAQKSSVKSILIKTMKDIMLVTKEAEPSYTKIKVKLEEIENGSNPKKKSIAKQVPENKKDSEHNNFPTPNAKDVPKRKKKETSIVNTVVENGEEYVVVKSNWKFNPRKLTENQKEKLQRKREDIPALYQDLSQSQDEFKLVSWKTDSQDTSSNSKSESKSSITGSNDTSTEILKKTPSSNVVLENFFSEIDKRESINNTKDLANKDSVSKLETPSPKNTKSPRMALKDRVFRNVRNLIEKSGAQKENKDVASEDLNKTLNIIKTPTQTKLSYSDNVVNSAPPLLSADRPSRVKRKPRKFEELELLTSKKIRQNTNGSDGKSPKLITEEASASYVHKVIDMKEDDNNLPKEPVIINVDEKDDDPKNDHGINVVTKNENKIQEKAEKTNDDKIEDLGNNETKSTNAVTTDKVITEQEKQPNATPVTKACDTSEKEKRQDVSGDTLKITDVPLNKEVSTPKQTTKNKKVEEQKSTTKKGSVKKSRIEKELAIDMVEGHPFLKVQSEKRLTRKTLESVNSTRRKSVAEKLNKSKSEGRDKKTKEKNKSSPSTSIVVDESQDLKDSDAKDESSFSEDLPFSDDIIESSQDSTATTISVKSTKKTPKKVASVVVVTVEKFKGASPNKDMNESQSILEGVAVNGSKLSSEKQASKNDIELSVNKTLFVEKADTEFTESMDTEPMDGKNLSDVIVIDDVPDPVTVSDETVVGTQTQELAEADTQPTDLKEIMEIDVTPEKISDSLVAIEDSEPAKGENIEPNISALEKSCKEKSVCPTDVTVTMSESACADLEITDVLSSPVTDHAKRNQDFLNNTLEISPIKTMSPDRNKKSPSPETSSDYVVIKLSSPVQSNGEPYEKCGSPEVFTEDKVSPDKRDQSPPRTEVAASTSSPSSSLSLKKNRPQVRTGGRGAQMLGLCVPDKVQAIVNPDRTETEEIKKCSTPNMQARRNLRILYSSVSDNTEATSEIDESENFLKFRKSLPAVDSSPSGPILKRKLADIIDEVTISPASKRKRVSFHDPPVSTTVSVQKYIEPLGVRSPQNSAQKRLERQLRQHTPIKSPKRLANVFKLDTVLTKTVESFTDDVTPSDDTQAISLDETPVVEIVRASELNDTDPICPELVDCEDSIDNIAGELSSPAMKILLVKELEGKIRTVGDLAKMTELEVNRLCIKAPKVKVAKKVLTDYVSKRVEIIENEKHVTVDAAEFDEPMVEDEVTGIDMEVQTDKNISCEMEVQTMQTPTSMNSSQTDVTHTENVSVQTNESGSKTTADIIKMCISERSDFVEQLSEHLEESSVSLLSEKLTFNGATDVLMKKATPCNAPVILNRLLDQLTSKTSEEKGKSVKMAFIRDFVCKSFDAKDLALFCSDVLKTAFDKPA